MRLLVSLWCLLCYDHEMKSIPIGELMISVYREMLEIYDDEDMAAVATADFINKYLKQLQEEEKSGPSL